MARGRAREKAVVRLTPLIHVPAVHSGAYQNLPLFGSRESNVTCPNTPPLTPFTQRHHPNIAILAEISGGHRDDVVQRAIGALDQHNVASVDGVCAWSVVRVVYLGCAHPDQHVKQRSATSVCIVGTS